MTRPLRAPAAEGEPGRAASLRLVPGAGGIAAETADTLAAAEKVEALTREGGA